MPTGDVLRGTQAVSGADQRQRRDWALTTFVAIVLAQTIWLFTGPGPALWVNRDEWRQIARPWTLDSLLADHNSHLSLIPILIYKTFFAAFGFAPFWPYRLLAVLLTASIAVLVRMLMVRCGVQPWIATLCAAPLLFVQGGSIMIAQFQMTLGLAFGLAALLVARTGRFTVFGAVSAVLAVGSSGIAIPVVGAAAVIGWLRHGWRRAALLTAPAGVLYLAWWLSYTPDVPELVRQPLPAWLAKALWQVPLALSGYWWAAAVLVTALVAGSIWIKGPARPAAVLEPAVLAVAAVIMFVLTYLGRGLWAPEGPFFARFVFLACTLSLPLLAWATQRMSAHRPALLTLVAVPLALGAGVNVSGWRASAPGLAQVSAETRVSMAALLRSPAGADVPDWVQPDGLGDMGAGTGDATWGALRTITPARIGVAGVAVPAEYANRALLQLRLAAIGAIPQASTCTEYAQAVDLRLQTGDRFGVRGAPAFIGRQPLWAWLLVDGRPQEARLRLNAGSDGTQIQVVGAPGQRLEVRLESSVPETMFWVCR